MKTFILLSHDSIFGVARAVICSELKVKNGTNYNNTYSIELTLDGKHR